MGIHIPLPSGTYYRLRFLQACAERDAHAAECVALRAAAQAEQAQQAFLSALHKVAHDIDFDPSIPYTWDDTSTALIAPESHGQS